MSRHTEAAARDPRVLREQVKDTRAELGDTVAALVAKTDVRARARRRATDARVQARHAASVAREGGRRAVLPLAAAGVVGLLTAAWVLRRLSGRR
ncbi:DUF3618 domain-containing protein [Streptomyces sp. JJ38]|uniref:DUF3618 domain-containing protein n=1 Tax=Streptomyces sp. JJ38 TaxID=2738128 RepID=UPI001C58DE22|nr:DUF3618 domain-containing protein [Streptomyces sp. JJ38]MBW1598078.1 DUF3618 domain-containing protein [Streptomyces sp. JJ38]